MKLQPIATRQPETCDNCGAAIPRHAMVFFAKTDKWNVCCSQKCANAMEKPQPPEAA